MGIGHYDFGYYVLTTIIWYLFISKTLLYSGWGIFSIRDSAGKLSEYPRKYNWVLFIRVGCVCISKNYGWNMKNNSTSCSNKQRGSAKISNFRFVYMQKFLIFAFLFCESKNLKNWANGVSHKHSNREIKLWELQKKLYNHNFCLLFMGSFVGKTYRKVFLSEKNLRTFRFRL